MVTEIVGGAAMFTGLLFFIAGTVGLLRFPDVYTRLHSLTKADNLGLGLVVTGLAVTADTVGEVLKLGLIWLLVIFAGATVSYLVARTAFHRGIKPWRSP